MLRRWRRFKHYLKVPNQYYRFHGSGCGTAYRGCSPDCPKDHYEETGEWFGPSRFQAFMIKIKEAFKEWK